MLAIHVDMTKVEECVRTSEEWRAHCEKITAMGVAHAQSVAPVVTGKYKSNIFGQVVPSSTPGSVLGAPSATIGDTVPYVWAVEKRHHVLYEAFHLMAKG